MASVNVSGILLESGTNEMEILEFTINNDTFGINVAKVREIMIPEPVKAMPLSHPAIEGVFKPRDLVLTVINLPKYLGIEGEWPDKTLLIVANFNKINIAFRVHTVVGIERISWESIEKPDKTIYGGSDGVATGLAHCDKRLITILDFEKIVADISPSTSIQQSEIETLGERTADGRPIIVVEDSVLLSKMILQSLRQAKFTNIIKYDNGKEAWNFLQEIKNEPDVRSKAALIITDIEMPQMDGHRLTKLVKTNDNLKQIPIVIFSSLINDEMYRKGKEIGADEQLSKPEIAHLIEVIDLLISSK